MTFCPQWCAFLLSAVDCTEQLDVYLFVALVYQHFDRSCTTICSLCVYAASILKCVLSNVCVVLLLFECSPHVHATPNVTFVVPFISVVTRQLRHKYVSKMSSQGHASYHQTPFKHGVCAEFQTIQAGCFNLHMSMHVCIRLHMIHSVASPFVSTSTQMSLLFCFGF